MPWVVAKRGDCPKDKPWGVYNAITGRKVACHSDEKSANDQRKALYANNAMSEGGVTTNSYYAFAEEAIIGDDGLIWIEALPAKVWHTPNFGEVPVDESKLQNFVKNFSDNIRGQEITTDYEHGADPAKGRKASGTFRKLEIRPRDDGVVSLWAAVEPTPTALNEIKNKEWRYFSLEWEDEWTHPETNQVHKDVIVGGALTNRPVAKGMAPINFSEVAADFLDVNPEQFDEPGQVNPGVDDDHMVDDSGKEGWRVDDAPDDPRRETVSDPNEGSPNLNEGGESVLTEEQLKELFASLGLGDDAKPEEALVAAKAMSEELEPLRKLREETNAQKKFAEEYPEEAKRLAELESNSQATFAKQFAESFETKRVVEKSGEGDQVVEKPTTLGLSARVLDEIGTLTKEFSEGSPKFDTFKNVLDALFDNGIVDYGTHGSTRENNDDEPVVTPGTKSGRVAFSEKIKEIQAKDELSFDDALVEAAKRHPKLAEAWRESNIVSV
jgi:phage I-like protein